jgi:hypothetical protein
MDGNFLDTATCKTCTGTAGYGFDGTTASKAGVKTCTAAATHTVCLPKNFLDTATCK